MMETLDWTAMRRNQGELAAMMLRLLDQGDQRFAVLMIPEAAFMQTTVRAVEDVVRREHLRAKRDRPGLVVKLTPPTDDYPDAALLVILHEHEWVAGRCVNGCQDQRP